MKILFMCVANSARSQLAEGLARSILRETEVESAGSQPGKLNPYAVAVMKEIGIDLSAHYSKSVNDLRPGFVEHLDYVIKLCAEEVCPLLVSKARKLHWPLSDPAGQGGSDEEQLQRFRETRDELRKRLETFGREIRPL